MNTRHPMSVDALCALPPDIPNVDTASTILTGSSDGMVRAVQILPTKLLGVVADHGEWPIERISIGGGQRELSIDATEAKSEDKNQNSNNFVKSADDDDEENDKSTSSRRWWVGSVGHEEVLRMTDLEGFFRDNESNQSQKGALGVNLSDDDDSDDSGGSDRDSEGDEEGKIVGQPDSLAPAVANPTGDSNKDSKDESDSDSDSDSDSPPPPPKRKRKDDHAPIPMKKTKKGKNTNTVEPSFFDQL